MSDPTPQITLDVDGRRYGGWLTVDVQRSFDLFSNSFNLTYTDQWADSGVKWPIHAGNYAEVRFGDALLLTGWVNVAEWLVTSDDWSLNASGRSLSQDLEDCSALHPTGHWKNKSPLAIIRELVQDYGLDVNSTAAEALLPIASFGLQEAETVHEAIERLCKTAKVIPISMPDGSIELVRSDIPRDKALVFPVSECIQRKFSENDQNRYSDYYTIGQGKHGTHHVLDPVQPGIQTIHHARNLVRNNKRAATTPNREILTGQRESVTDDGVERYRPLVMVAEHAMRQREQLLARSQWERNVRIGRGYSYRATIPGVLAPNGKPWTIGWHCVVKDGPLGVDTTMVITSTNVRATSNELVTEIAFVLPETFSTLTYPARKRLDAKPVAPKPAEVCLSPADLDAYVIAHGGTT